MNYDGVIDELKYITENIDLKYLNINLIEKNIEYLYYNIYLELKKEYEEVSKLSFTIENANPTTFTYVRNGINNFKTTPQKKKHYQRHVKNVYKINYENLYFLWVSFDFDDKDNTENAIKMFKIMVSLKKFYKTLDKTDINRIVIWYPFDAERNFYFDDINDETLLCAKNDFGAFTTSGETNNRRIGGISTGTDDYVTVITRYEEVEKLLLHELVHNFNIDGKMEIMNLESINSKYNSVKSKDNYVYYGSILESYTELSSTYFYLVFKNIIDNVENVKEKLFGQILTEILYSYNVIANLIKLNGYPNYEAFKKSKSFKGIIPFYEYYYVKALLYNNFEYKLAHNLDGYINIYEDISCLIKKINNNDDKLMEEIYNHSHKNLINFKYQLH
jgi:hypothetical protein